MNADQPPSNASRRHFIATAGAASLALATPAIVRAQGRKTMKISVGRQPWAAGNSPVTAYMMEQKSFERLAAAAGYDLTVDYRDYPSAAPMVEAFVSGNLNFGMWGNTPIVRLIAQHQPIQLLTVGEGHFRFVLATRKDSPIRNIADLKGKTVGALLGGDPYNVLSQMLRFELGNPDPKAFGITVVNTPTQAQAATIPGGMDAAVVIHPAFLKAQKELGTVGIMNSFGYTEAHYKGPAGEGAGHLLPSVKKSPFYPDGYYLHRSFWIGSAKIIQSDPAIVTAFVQAQQEAVAVLSKMDAGKVSQLAVKYWELPPDLGAKVVEDDVLFKRGWCWPTEGDAAALLETSKSMVDGKLIQKPLTWGEVKGAFATSAAPVKVAYDRTGAKPDLAAFEAKNTADLRGNPIWMMDHWADRS
ncbi:MAG TPA: PhnD/SsuA/transferrin family substrate-binding protein [Casimicrobiaceae bacterium]|nr:PhnD/SsuA/transferrin family substrate-binding protein [Casimicrobiaceae bacterium]